MGTFFTKLSLFFHKISFIINTHFPPLSKTVNASHVGVLHAHSASPRRLLQKDPLQGAETIKSAGAKSGF
jgi:predicted ATP-binding protein involved in virulence